MCRPPHFFLGRTYVCDTDRMCADTKHAEISRKRNLRRTRAGSRGVWGSEARPNTSDVGRGARGAWAVWRARGVRKKMHRADAAPPCNNGYFVSLVANARYAGAAMCLRHQLRHVQSNCPMLLVYNDDVEMPVESLQTTFGEKHLVKLSSLKQRYLEHVQRNAAPSGRRLFEGNTEVANTHLKLWLWALPSWVHKAVFLDLDMLILRNVDALMDTQLSNKTIYSLGSVTCKSMYGDRFFNSGLLVFAPSMVVLRKLFATERWVHHPWYGHIPNANEQWVDICAPANDTSAATRLFPNSSNPIRHCRSVYGPGRQPGMMTKACENKLTDQSIFNTVFSAAHRTLVPSAYNDATRFNVTGSYIVHFVGEPKPWDAKAGHGRDAAPARAKASSMWRERCASQHLKYEGQNSTAPHVHGHDHANSTSPSTRI